MKLNGVLMAVADVNVARPAYMNWTLFRDYHYAVFNKAGEMVAILVTTKGDNSSYWINEFNKRDHSIVYENHVEKARIIVGQYMRDCTDLLDYLKKGHPEGEYYLSIVDASGNRLYSFTIWI